MCGICGIYRFDGKSADPVLIDEMVKVLAHRGPDGPGTYIGGCVGLGHTRLSIVDLSIAGKQPMSISSGKTIVFNGEIYNHIELRTELEAKSYKFLTRTDTEVILNLYEEYGESCLHKLRGMFSFVIFDEKKKAMFAARDRFGIKPFYYFKNDEKFIFASEIKGVLADSSVARLCNEHMLYDFLVYNRTDHTDQTCFQDIFNLRPGHYIKIENNQFSISSWYTPPAVFCPQQSVGEEKVISEVKESLTESIKLHLRGDVEVGACLSGGLDSSAIVCLVNNLKGSESPTSTFSAVYDPNWDRDEKVYIDAAVEKTGSKPYFTSPNSSDFFQDLKDLIYCQEEPFSDAAVYSGYAVMKEAKKAGIKVLLDGQGADELFGYEYMAAFYFKELMHFSSLLRFFKEVTKFVFTQKNGVIFTLQVFAFLLLPRVFQNFYLRRSSPLVSKGFLEENRPFSNFHDNFFQAKSLNESARNHILYKLNHLLRFEDKNSMAFSIETRLPYLDHVFVESSLNIAPSMKIKNGRLKHVLRESVADLLPKIVYDRNNKIGFEAPQNKWIHDKRVLDLISATFSSSDFRSRCIFDVEKVLKEFEKMKMVKSSFSQDVWKAFCVELWFQVFKCG